MNLLFCGDVVGKSGRKVVCEEMPRLRRDLKLDYVVVNVENAAGGYGITPALCEAFYEAGVDVLTTGNHIWDQREIVPYIARDPRLLRPCNYPESTPGGGWHVGATATGVRVLVINVMGRLFMEPLDDPFATVDRILDDNRMGEAVDVVVVDVHGETSSEKQAIGHYLDGRVSLVVGSHTHTPTADTMIFAGGTAFQTDAGMCGDYDSVIGSDTEQWVARFRRKMPVGRILPSEGPGTLCGVYVEVDQHTGAATRATPLILGGALHARWPG